MCGQDGLPRRFAPRNDETGDWRLKKIIASLVLGLALTSPALAATEVDGATMPLLWAIPFAGMLLSIALGPLLFADIWHHHYGKISAAWAALIVAPMALIYG